MHDYERAERPKQSCEKMNGAGRGWPAVRPVPVVSVIMGGRRFKLLPSFPPSQPNFVCLPIIGPLSPRRRIWAKRSRPLGSAPGGM